MKNYWGLLSDHGRTHSLGLATGMLHGTHLRHDHVLLGHFLRLLLRRHGHQYALLLYILGENLFLALEVTLKRRK